MVLKENIMIIKGCSIIKKEEKISKVIESKQETEKEKSTSVGLSAFLCPSGLQALPIVSFRPES